MNVEIRDKALLHLLLPQNVRAYLTLHGWRELEQVGTKGWIYGKGDIEVPLVSDKSLGDFSARMAELVKAVADDERRSQLYVYNDLMVSDSDIVRLRALKGDEFGTLPFRDGVSLYEDAKKMMQASACSVVEYRTYYRNCNFPAVREYIDSVRLGQTERGSYVLTLLSPIPRVTPAARTETELEEEHPFPRQVTRRLGQSWQALHEATMEAVEADDFAPFERRAEFGLNANLCESVAGLVSHGKGAELSIGWAATLPMDEPIPPKTFLPSDKVSVIHEAALEFKRNEPEMDVRFIGKVVRLDRDPEAFDGRATLLLDIKNRMRKVTLQFPQDEYNQVIHAFKEKSLISIEGDLLDDGGHYEVRNPRKFAVHQGEESELD